MKSTLAIVFLLFTSLAANGQELQLFSADGDTLPLSWYDAGSGANIDGSFWGAPISPFPAFSHIARRGYGRPAEMLLAVELQPGLATLADPVSFQQVWNDSGSGADLDGAVWRPTAPEGYVCLGMVVTRGAAPALDSIACLRQDLAVLGTVGDLIWWDQGSGANADFSAWDINCPAGSVDIDGFIGVNNYFKPAGPVWCIDEDAVQTPPSPALPAAELLLTDQSTLAWWDVGSGADIDGSFWAPTVPAGEGISVTSHVARRGYGAPLGTIVARETQAGAFANPRGYELVWTDAGSGANLNGAVWRPVAPIGYRCLGMVVTNGAAPAEDAMQCVHRDIAVPGTVGGLAWWDQGSGANQDFSAWDIDCPDDAIDTDGFIGVQGYGAPTSPVFCLSAAAVTAPAAPTLAEVEQLIGQYGPVIRFHPNEQFLPDDPAAIIDDPTTTIVWETVENENDYATFVETFLGSYDNPTSATILDDVQNPLSHPQAGDANFRYFLDFSANGALRSGDLDRAQAYVRVQPLDGVYVELQFWIFYPWNGPGKAEATCGIIDVGTYDPTGRNGEHYSDWESLRVRVTDALIGSEGTYTFTDIVLSRHSFEEVVGASDPRLQYLNGRPVVYSARDSHAHYLSAGRHVYLTNTTDLGLCDLDVELYDLTGDGQQLATSAPGNYSIQSSAWPEIETTSYDWLFFGGRWGGYDRAQFCTDPSGVYEVCESEVQNGKPGLIRRNEWNVSCPINANLGALRTSAGTLSPAFSPNVTSYTLGDLSGATELVMTPLAMNHDALVEVRINGGAWSVLPAGTLYGRASDPLALAQGANSVEVRVTVPGCGAAPTVRTYTVDIPSAQRFGDVGLNYWAYAFIEALATSGVTSGCGGGNFCPDNTVTRAQMAVFLERGMRGSGFVPPPATGTVFGDVAANAFAARFIEQLFADGITGGCGGGNYCPNNNVTRAQMAVFLLRAVNGTGYTPPPATGVFPDAPPGSFAANWIEALAAAGISGGCGGGNFCPNDPVTRAQMAVFLVRAFGL